MKLRVSEIFKRGSTYDVITKYKEIPVRARFRLRWTDDEGRLLGFEWGKTHLRSAFSTVDPVYVKLDSREYAQTQVFSNLGKELVLTVENFVGPPEFIRRRSVRVEPDKNKPVAVEVLFEDRGFKTLVRDISETGVGVILRADSDREFIAFLRNIFRDKEENQALEFSVRLHLPTCGTVSGKGRLRNVVSLGSDLRLGLEVSFPREELNKVRRYVITRQKEIIKSLRMVE